jgi:hypothetical protein
MQALLNIKKELIVKIKISVRKFNRVFVQKHGYAVRCEGTLQSEVVV